LVAVAGSSFPYRLATRDFPRFLNYVLFCKIILVNLRDQQLGLAMTSPSKELSKIYKKYNLLKTYLSLWECNY